MVYFTSHTFTFSKKNKEIYFKLISKYYSGIEAYITLNSEDDCVIIKNINLAYQTLNELPDADTYVIKTVIFQKTYITVKMLPKFDMRALIYSNGSYTTDQMDTAKIINFYIKKRMMSGCYKLPVNTFPDILASLSLLTVMGYLMTENITRYYISHKSELILLVFNDSQFIVIGKFGISDNRLPSFDIKDGFISDEIYPQEWDEDFNKWKKEFDETNGSNWDDPVINIPCTQFNTVNGFPPNSSIF